MAKPGTVWPPWAWGGLLATLVGCGPAPAATPATSSIPPGDVRVATDRLDPARWLSGPADRAVRAGAGPLRSIGAAAAAEGDRVGGFVELGERDCLAAVARASETIRDTDLFAFSDAGDLVASDESTAAGAAIVICPPHPRRLYVVARVMAGRGIVAVGALGVRRSSADAVAAALGAPRLDAADRGRLAAWPGLDAKIRRRRQQLGADWEDLRRAVLPLDPRAASTLSVPMTAGHCFDVLAVPGQGVHAIDLWVTDGLGRILGRGQPPGRDRGLVICAAHGGTLTAHVRPRASMGPVAVVVGHSRRGAATQLSSRAAVAVAHPLAGLAVSTARHRERTRGLAISPPVRSATVEAIVGAAEPVPLRFDRGCTRIDAIGGAPLGAAAAELWSPDGRPLGRGLGAAVTTLFRCGPAGTASLEVRAELSAGPVAIEQRVDRQPPAILLRHPEAAGRLLGLLEAVAGPVAPERAARAEAIAVAADRRHSSSVVLPDAGCVDLFAAVAGDLRGVALRHVEPVSGQAAISRGRDAVTARICAARAASIPYLLEVDAGSGEALLLVEEAPRSPKADSAPR